MLAASGYFNIVTARHVIEFDRLQRGERSARNSRAHLQSWFDQHNLVDRSVDVVSLGPDTPEEYGFILDKLDAGTRITPRNFFVFQRICEVIQRDCANDRPLLLKNPWDFGNEAVIKSLMPDAKIIHIHRNPFHVLSSLFRLLVQASRRPHPYLCALSRPYQELTESEFLWRLARRFVVDDSTILAKLIIHQVARQANAHLREIGHSSDRTDHVIRFEQLCKRPNEIISEILRYCGAATGKKDYSRMIQANASNVAPAIKRQRTLVLAKLSTYARSVGYDLETLTPPLRE